MTRLRRIANAGRARFCKTCSVRLICVVVAIVVSSSNRLTHAAEVQVGKHRDVLIDGEPFYPVCVIHASWSDIERMGFNCVLSGGVSRHSDLTQSYEHHVLDIPEFSSYTRSANLAGAQAAAAGVRNAPILANYVVDEPHYSGLSPSQVRADSELIKRSDPNHLTLVIDERDIAARYAQAADVIGLDVYPIRWTGHKYGFPGSDSLALIGNYVAAVAAASGSRPVWFVEQAHLIPHDASYPEPERYPTPAEERVMAYEALNHGATGILFYAYNDHWQGAQGFAADPTLMGYLPSLVGEIKQVLPKYTYGSVTPTDSGSEIDAVSIDYNGERTIVAVNPTGRTLTGTIPCAGLIKLDPISVHVARCP